MSKKKMVTVILKHSDFVDPETWKKIVSKFFTTDELDGAVISQIKIYTDYTIDSL